MIYLESMALAAALGDQITLCDSVTLEDIFALVDTNPLRNK